MDSGNFETVSFKVVVVGDTGVGKSSLLRRFHLDEYHVGTEPTVGVEHYSHELTVRDQRVQLRLWDTAGQERFHSLCHAYYRGAEGVIAVFDVTRQESFDAVFSYWLPEVKRETAEETVCILVGNKSDLKDTFDLDQAEKLSRLHSLELELTSAQEGDNINHVFHLLAEKMITRANQEASILPGQAMMSQSIFLHDHAPAAESAVGCCSGNSLFSWFAGT